MKVKELIELNQMITDIEITVRIDGCVLLDQLNIGMERGRKPPYPTLVPKSKKFVDNISIETKREAYYLEKSINSWDDGKNYWQVKPNRIPNNWLELEVFAWEVWPASTYGRRDKNVNFHGQRLNIVVLPFGESLQIKETLANKKNNEFVGQLSFNDLGITI